MFAFLEQFVKRGCSPFHPDFPVFAPMVIPLPPMGQTLGIECDAYRPESDWHRIDVNEVCQVERRTSASFISQCIHNAGELLNPNVPVQQLEILISQEDDRRVATIVHQAKRWYPWLPLSSTQTSAVKPSVNAKSKLVNRFRNCVITSKGQIPEPRIDSSYRRLCIHTDKTLTSLTKEAIKTTDFWKERMNKHVGYLPLENIVFETDIDVLWMLSSYSSLHLIKAWTNEGRKDPIPVRWTLTEQYGSIQHGRRKKIELLGDFVKHYIGGLQKDEIVSVKQLNQKFNPSKRKVYKPTRRQWLLALRNITALDNSMRDGPVLHIE